MLPDNQSSTEQVGEIGAPTAAPRHVFALAGLLLCVVLAYLPVVMAAYGFTDDYYDLQDVCMGGGKLWRHHVSEGRPVMALLHAVLFPMAGSVSNLRWLRALNLASLCVLAGALYVTLCRVGFGRAVSAAFSFAVAMLPGFQICTAWAATTAIPFAATVAGAAAYLAMSVADNRKGSARALRFCLACLLSLAALMIYQPAGMFFWVFAALVLLTSRQGDSVVTRRFRWCLAISASTLAAEFIAFKIGAACYGAGNAQRLGLTQDVPGKLIWFLKQPLKNALNLDSFEPSRRFAAVMAVFIVAGLLLSFAGPWKRRVTRLAMALFLAPLSYLPNLAAVESYAPHRTQVALTPLIACCLLVALRGCLGALPSVSRQSRDRMLLLVVGGWALVSGVTARRNVVQYMAQPQAVEYRLVKSQLLKIESTGAQTIYFIPASLSDRLTRFICYYEFGTPSSSKTWAGEGMVKCGLRDMGREATRITVVAVDPEQLHQLPPHAAVIDMRQLKQSQ